MEKLSKGLEQIRSEVTGESAMEEYIKSHPQMTTEEAFPQRSLALTDQKEYAMNQKRMSTEEAGLKYELPLTYIDIPVYDWDKIFKRR